MPRHNKRKSLEVNLHLIANEKKEVNLHLTAKNSMCLFDLLLYAPGNSSSHVGTLAVKKDVKQYFNQTKISILNKTQVVIICECMTRVFCLCVTGP